MDEIQVSQEKNPGFNFISIRLYFVFPRVFPGRILLDSKQFIEDDLFSPRIIQVKISSCPG